MKKIFFAFLSMLLVFPMSVQASVSVDKNPAHYHSGWNSQSAYLDMKVNEVNTVWIKFANKGTATWYNNGTNPVHLGTSNSLDRSSSFYTSSWLANNRSSALSESQVAPGGVGTFTFEVKAPATVGHYREYFRPVVEGLTWMEDNGVYIDFNVSESVSSSYSSQLDSHSEDINIASLDTETVWAKYKNTGTATWYNYGSNPIHLGTDRTQDRTSKFYNSSWLSQNRVASLKESVVKPGEIGTFEFTIKAPTSVGTYSEYFRPVAEGLTWFNDNNLFWKFTVTSSDNETDEIDLTASSNSSGVKLSWDKYNDKDIDGYKILKSTTDSSPTFPDQSYRTISDYSTTSYTDTSVSNGTKYYYRIGVYQDGEVIEYSDTVSITYNEDDSDDSSDLNLTVDSSNDGVELSWDEYDDEDIDGYKILRSTSDSSPTYPDQSYTYISGYDNTDYTDGSVKDGTKYYYRIGIYQDGEVIEYSDTVSITYNEDDSDDSSDLNLTVDSSSDGVELSWDRYNDSSVDGYKILRSTSNASPTYPGQSYTYINGYNSTDYTDGSVNDGTKYYYRIGVYEDGEVIEYSDTVSITYNEDDSSNDDDFELTAENSAYGVKLNWDKYNNSDVYYVILRSTTDSTPTYSEQLYNYITDANDTDYIDSGISDGTKYYYRIAVYLDDEILAYSNIVSIHASK